MGDRRRVTRALAPGICILAIAGLVRTAHAALTPVPETEEIVVTGERLSPAQARERAVAYVQHTGIVAGKESVARWVDPVCPRAIGIAPEHVRLVEAKVRAIAAQAGVPTAKPGCTTNVSINFVGDGGAFVRSVAARDRGQLSKVPADLRLALLNGSAPVRWWYLTELRGRDGDRMNGMEPAFVSGAQNAGATLPSNGETSTLLNYGSSIVSTQTARALRQATVVVDTVRAEGATLDAIAAYAALVAFAEMQPRDTPLAGSILGLFGSDPAPRGLTKLDLTFLRELYSLPLDRKARQQRGRLVRALQNEQSKF